MKGFTDEFDTIGHITAGDTIGEEGLFEVNAIRKDTAIADEECYLMEYTKDKMI